LVASEIFGLSRKASDTAEGESWASRATSRKFIGEQLTKSVPRQAPEN
jgi:hypothetical protein